MIKYNYIYTILRFVYHEIKNLRLFFRFLFFLIGHNSNKNILLLLTPIYENLGDQAIAYAELQFLNDNFSDYRILEVTNDFINYQSWKVLRIFQHFFHCAIITGGGFLGTLWLHNEKQVRTIIKGLSRIKIIIFPQTVFFSQDEEGSIEVRKTNYYLKNHDNIYLLIRDESISFVKKNIYNIKCVANVPDIVFYLNKCEPRFIRNGILFCFRNDKEKAVNADSILILKEKLIAKGKLVSSIDTLAGHNIKVSAREKELSRIWNIFKSAELVITDRLHAMLFCLITGTPCIAVDNQSRKVSGVYNLWLSECPYIYFFSCMDMISESFFEKCFSLKENFYNPDLYSDSWKTIREVIAK